MEYPESVAGFVRAEPSNPRNNYQHYRKPGGRGIGFTAGWSGVDTRDDSVGFVTAEDLRAGLRQIRNVESDQAVIYPGNRVIASE